MSNCLVNFFDDDLDYVQTFLAEYYSLTQDDSAMDLINMIYHSIGCVGFKMSDLHLIFMALDYLDEKVYSKDYSPSEFPRCKLLKLSYQLTDYFAKLKASHKDLV